MMLAWWVKALARLALVAVGPKLLRSELRLGLRAGLQPPSVRERPRLKGQVQVKGRALAPCWQQG